MFPAALILFAQRSIGVRGIALVTFVVPFRGCLFTVLRSREHVKTIRRRLESRRLDVEGARIQVQDAETVRLLEATAAGSNPRQAAYALSLLSDAPRYDAKALLTRLAGSPHPEVRTQLYALARKVGSPILVDQATAEIAGSTPLPFATRSPMSSRFQGRIRRGSRSFSIIPTRPWRKA